MYYQKKSYFTRAKKTTIKGKDYDSKFEASYAMTLEAQLQKGEIIAFTPHKRIELIVNGYHICNYYIDFWIQRNDGKIELLETKGFPTEIWKMKWKLLEAIYGDDEQYILTVIFQRKGKAPKARKVK